jgi:hypothetical protein
MMNEREAADAHGEWQADVQRLRAELAPALERARRGEGHELDIDEFVRRCRERYEPEPR